MKRFSYHTSSVLICDHIGPNRAATYATLFTIGFRNIEISASPADFRDALTAGSFDLAICECQGVEEELFSVIQTLRRGDLGHNPFLVLVATAWVKSTSLITRAMDSGVDDFLLQPLSPEILSQCIATLIEHRKGFNISRDYIGPVRESDQRQPLGKPFFPPNSLRLKAEDRLGPEAANLQLARELRLGRHRLETRMLWCDAFQIGVRLRLTAEYGRTSSEHVGNFAKVTALARAFEARVQKSRSEMVIRFCQAVLSEIDALSKNRANLDTEALGQAAWNLYHCIDPARSFEDYCNELTATALLARDKERSENVASA